MKWHTAKLRAHLTTLVSFMTVVSSFFWSTESRAQCPTAPTVHANGAVEGPVTASETEGRDATIASDGQRRFIVAWQFDDLGLFADDEIRVLRFDANGMAICTTGPQNIADAAGASGTGHRLPSIAINAIGDVVIAWQGRRESGSASDRVMRSDFHFDDDPTTWPVRDAPVENTRTDFEPSVAVAASGANKAFAWAYKDFDDPPPPNGLVRALNPDAPLPPIRECEPTAF
jgi:hypothetical protein